jgi:hypothetical protein
LLWPVGLCQLRATKPRFDPIRIAVSPQSRLTLACILLTILLDMVGLGIILPVLPQLLFELTGGSVAEAAVIGGYLVFSYSLMQSVGPFRPPPRYPDLLARADR